MPNMTMQKIFALCVLMAICLSGRSLAQSAGAKQPWEEYDKLVQKSEAIGALGPDLFGESVGFFNGSLSFNTTDVSLPGNNGLPVAFSRSFTVDNTAYDDFARDKESLADWELETPRIVGVFGGAQWESPCSATTAIAARPLPKTVAHHTFYPDDYWSGNRLIIPGKGSEEMLVGTNSATPKPSSGGPFYWVTPSFTWFSCLPARKNTTGQGFLAVTADGTKYWFDWQAAYIETALKGPRLCSIWGCGEEPQLGRMRVALYATRVEDRFGNWVTYTYANPSGSRAQLTSIQSSDGRQISVAYNGNGHVSTVTANGRIWTYQYNYPAAYRGTLTAVVLPDGSRWNMNLAALADAGFGYNVPRDTSGGEGYEVYRTCFNPGDLLDNNAVVGTITHPSGAVGEYTMKAIGFGRTNVPAVCANFQWPGNNPNDDVSVYPIRWHSMALIKKRVSGHGLTAAEWNYSYSSPSSHFLHPSGGGRPICGTNADCRPPQCVSDTCAGSSTTTIAGPSGSWQRHTYGNSYRYNEGKLLKIEEGSGPTAILSTQISTYRIGYSGQPYPTPLGESPQLRRAEFASEYLIPQTGGQTIRDGVTFRWQVESSCGSGAAICLDGFGRSTRIKRYSTLPAAPLRTEDTVYEDFASLWVLGQTKKTINVDTGTTLSEVVFDARAQPHRIYGFGSRLHYILTYSPGGQLDTATDGRGHTTQLSDYHRGIPRLISYPDSTTEAVVVDDNGWIASVTDETGAKTCYGYDDMGRMASIVYPSETQAGVCDTSRWSPVSMAFQPISQNEHGLPAGHWRASRYEGNKHTHIYYDAMWRPVLEETFDASDVGGTLSQTVKRYDSRGRINFQSYPQRGVGNYWDVTQGTRTSYDALDRAVRVEQDSEHGALVTTTEYLPGLQMRVTNPRGQQTTTGFMAWETPNYELPLWSVQPEGKVIEIARHSRFGWPLQLKQRSADSSQQQTRSYVYDGYGQLCKTIEPETGATVVGYDAANNPVWSASGLTGGNYASTSDCSQTAANASGRAVTRQYDARNRLTALLFPDVAAIRSGPTRRTACPRTSPPSTTPTTPRRSSMVTPTTSVGC
jgi:RHS Repeat